MSTHTQPTVEPSDVPTNGRTAERRGLTFDRVFSRSDVHPYEEIAWQRRPAIIPGKDPATPMFRQDDVEVPKEWSDSALGIVAEKYFYGRRGTPERETSVRQMIDRVVGIIAGAGSKWGYCSPENAVVFAKELQWLLVNQVASFNSPVWFNVGSRPGDGYGWDFAKGDVAPCEEIDEGRYQISACFILGCTDTVGRVDDLKPGSITRNMAVETSIFKYGSGAGSNRSPLRSRLEPVTGGGRASGPVSFMKVYNTIGGQIASGGVTRRAAKMDILDVSHPDILDFILCKPIEEDKARALIAAGYEADFNGEAYQTVQFQNVNLTVRLSDRFMQAVEADEDWQTLSVVTGKPEAADGTTMPRYRARWLMDEIAKASWRCGDPNVQYDDTFQRWNTLANSGRINATNPCSEYCSLDDTSCNLASINLMKFRRDDGTFDVDRFRAAVRIMIVAMDILVDLGSYPTPEIARNAHRFRQLGLGYANLGALLMASGMPYDSGAGRLMAAEVTSLMTGEAYRTSGELAETLGPFDGFAENREPMLRVIDQHWRTAQGTIQPYDGSPEVWGAICEAWYDARSNGHARGYRNSTTTCIAPTGTIGLMMDCDTLSGEPALGLVVYKTLWGRGRLKFVNRTVSLALEALGYGEDDIQRIRGAVERDGSVENVVFGDKKHVEVFDCAFPARPGGRAIAPMGHVKMMAAIQPHIAMSMSKTCNLPSTATVEDIREIYMEGWKLGIKSLAVYRDGCKDSQPVSTRKEADGDLLGSLGDATGLPGDQHPSSGPRPQPGDDHPELERSLLRPGQGPAGQDHAATDGLTVPVRRRLPDTRPSLTHKFSIDGCEGYLTVGLFPDGRPGELFVTMAKEGSTIGGLMDSFACAVSLMLQYGVPLDVLVTKFSGNHYEPSGFSSNPDIPMARSLTDYVVRWLGMEFLTGYRAEHAPRRVQEGTPVAVQAPPATPAASAWHGPACRVCGGICRPSGTCWTCIQCGTSTGGCS